MRLKHWRQSMDMDRDMDMDICDGDVGQKSRWNPRNFLELCVSESTLE